MNIPVMPAVTWATIPVYGTRLAGRFSASGFVLVAAHDPETAWQMTQQCFADGIDAEREDMELIKGVYAEKEGVLISILNPY